MKRLIFFLISYLMMSIGMMAQDTAIVRTFGGEYGEEANQIIECAEGGYIVVGTTGSDVQNNSNIYVLRMSNDLICMWNKVLGTPQIDRGFGITQDSDGNFVICGYTNGLGAGGYDAIVIKINSEGETIWQKTFGGEDWDFASKIQTDFNGDYLFCGSTYSFGSGDRDAWLVRMDSDGNMIEQRTFGDIGDDAFTSLLIFNDTTYCLGGYSEQEDGNSPPWVISMNVDAVYYWEKLFTQYPNGQCNSLAKSADGTLLLTGEYATTTDAENAFIGKYYIDGALFFDQNTNNFTGTSIAEGSNYFYLLGNTTDFGAGGYGAYFARYLLDGNWITGASFGGEYDEDGRSLLVDSNDAILFAGYSESYSTGNTKDVYLVKFENPVTVADYTLDILHQTCFSVSIEPEVEMKNNHWRSAIESWEYSGLDNLLRVELYNCQGQLCAGVEGVYKESSLSQKGLPVGLYIVKWITENGDIYSQTLLKN